MRYTTILLLIVAVTGPLCGLRAADVYTVGNALKAQAAPADRLTLADFTRASIRVRWRGQRTDTVYAGTLFARLLTGPGANPDALLRAFPPGRLAAALQRVLSGAAGPVIVNLAGIRYSLGTVPIPQALPPVAVPPAAWQGAVLPPAREGASRLVRAAGGRSGLFEPGDLQGAVFVLTFRDGTVRIWRGAEGAALLAGAMRVRSPFWCSELLLARGLQNLANWAGRLQLHTLGHPPVFMEASAVVLARQLRERDRGKTPEEILTHLAAFAARYRYQLRKQRILPDRLPLEKTMDCDDFALYAWMLFRNNDIEAEILVIEPAGTDSPGTVFHAICAYRIKPGVLWRSVDYGPRFRRLDTGVPHYSLIPALLHRKPVRFLKVNTSLWRVGKEDPVIDLRRTDNWALSSLR